MQGSLFQQGASPTLRMIFCLILCLTMMILDQRFGHMSALRQAIDYAVTPLRYVVNAPFELLAWSEENLRTHNTLLAENQRLKEENIDLQTRQQKLDVLLQENQRLRKLLGSSSNISERSLVAELLTVSLDPYKQQIMLNKGSNADVYNGQPVISAQGIMGQVVHVGGFSSTALLISDPSHAMPVQINRNGLRTIAQGTGNPSLLELLYIPDSADIQQGDLVISSGLGGRFPANYPVAIVTSIERVPGQSFASVYAKPTTALDQVNEVLLIWPHPVEPGELEETETTTEPQEDGNAQAAN